jgi:hypothetical protein
MKEVRQLLNGDQSVQRWFLAHQLQVEVNDGWMD